jgi:hypothetical protein
MEANNKIGVGLPMANERNSILIEIFIKLNFRDKNSKLVINVKITQWY